MVLFGPVAARFQRVRVPGLDGEPGIGGSSRSFLYAKHGILPFSLGKRSLLVLRFASCEAVSEEPGIGGSSRSFWIFRPARERTTMTRDGEKATATRLLPSPAGRHMSEYARRDGRVENVPPRT
jgi:hypothetical protein